MKTNRDKLFKLGMELDREILDLQKQGFNVGLLCKAASLLVQFHNENLVDRIMYSLSTTEEEIEIIYGIENGSRMVFDYPKGFVTLSEYSKHRGEVVTVVRPCTKKEADQECQPMYVIKADDGWIGYADEDELVEVPQE